MRAVDVVSLIDPTASVFEHENGLYTVRGIFANGIDSHDTAKWETGGFSSPDKAWTGAMLLLEARNSGRFN